MTAAKPLLATAHATAAPTAKGASHITRPVNSNITAASASQNSRILRLGEGLTWASEIPKSTENTATCNTSLRAAASKKPSGAACSKVAARVNLPGGVLEADAAAVRWMPLPGCKVFAAATPMRRATVVTASK